MGFSALLPYLDMLCAVFYHKHGLYVIQPNGVFGYFLRIDVRPQTPRPTIKPCKCFPETE